MSLFFCMSEICCLLMPILALNLFLSILFLVWVYDWSLVWKPTCKELIKHEIPLVSEQLRQSYISWMHLNSSLSRHTCKFWKAYRILRCFSSLLKGLLHCLRQLQQIDIHEKVETREKSLDNWIVKIIGVRLTYNIFSTKTCSNNYFVFFNF